MAIPRGSGCDGNSRGCRNRTPCALAGWSAGPPAASRRVRMKMKECRRCFMAVVFNGPSIFGKIFTGEDYWLVVFDGQVVFWRTGRYFERDVAVCRLPGSDRSADSELPEHSGQRLVDLPQLI